MNIVMRLAALLSLLALTACEAGGDPKPEPEETASVRVLHLSPDAPEVDAFLGGSKRVVSGLAFGAGTAAIEAPAGTSSVQVSASGAPASQAAVELSSLRLEAERDYTLYAFGKLSNLALNALENDARGLSTNNVRVRVVHAADGVGTVNVLQVPAAGAPVSIAANLRYGTAAAPVDLPSEPITVGLDLDNDQAPDLSFAVPALPRGSVVNVFAVLDAAGAPFLLAQLSGSTVARLEPLQAQLRVLHLNAGAPAVSAFVDGQSPAGWSPLTFTRSTDFTTVAAGTLNTGALTVTPTSRRCVPSVELSGGGRYTAVAIGTAAAPQALFFENGAVELPAGSIRLRAVHAAPSVGTVDLFTLGADGTPQPLLADVPYAAVSSPLDVPAGAYTVGVDTDDDAKPELWFELPALAAGTVANVFVTEDAEGGLFVLAQLEGANTARFEPATSRVRVIHLSRNAPAVDVFVNGTRTVENLSFSQNSATLSVASGAYDFAVTAAGGALASAVLNADGVSLLPGRSYTVAAYADLANLTATVLEDDATGLDVDTSIRLNVIHVAPTVTRGDLYAVRPEGNLRLATDLGFGEAALLPDLASSSYRVGFDAEANGTIDIAFNLPVLAPGSYANIFVATDAAGTVCLLVQTTNAGILRVDASP